MNQRTAMNNAKSQQGFILLELTVVFVVTALLLLPLLKLALESIGSTREQLTEAALETATDALIAYAATNKGCLPFAADSEGGLTSIHYQITPEQVLDDRTTRKTGFTIVSTRITIKMLGLFDADLVSFSQAVIDELPGQVRPLSLALQRLTVPTEESLKALREGTLIDFVGGEFVFEWNTLRPLVKKAEN
jgi:type II secretory pathway pseudopilin PulG